MTKLLTLLFAFTLLFYSCSEEKKVINSNSEPFSHKQLDKLLRKYVNEEGWVDYKGLQADIASLDEYLSLVSSAHPNDKNWSKDEQLTYWINVYNAFTIKLILDNYPTKSILDIGGLIKVPGVASAWDLDFIEIEGVKYSLGEIEKDIIRAKFNEPRIHFALVCASGSCPKLKNEVYTVKKLEKQLSEQATEFINDITRNKMDEKNLKLSKIFDWYAEDFTKEGSLIDFLNQYATIKADKNAEIDYMDYDWGLNEQK